MEWFNYAVDVFLHLDRHLGELIQDYGALTYFILFLVIFCETGLVFTPFLPGDSLLFAAGTFGGMGDLSIGVLFLLLSVAAIVGDTVNYWIGKYLGQRILASKRKLVKPEHIAQTHEFFEKYGANTIVIARFVPIIRTVAPFVAGVGAMTYRKFIAYNIFGGILWVAICLWAGYFFGSREVVKKNFSLVILAIILISILPAVVAFFNARRRNARLQRQADALGTPTTAAPKPQASKNSNFAELPGGSARGD